MDVQTCKFVPGTDVFRYCPAVWDDFAAADDNPFNFGNNNRSMVSPSRLIDYVAELCGPHYDTEAEEREFERQQDLVAARLKSLPADVYVDLEE